MLRIVVTKPDFRELKGEAKATGKPYHLRIQTAHAYTIDHEGTESEFPEKFELMLAKDAEPYPRGKYTLAPSALIVRDGKLMVGDVRLVPFQPATK